MTLNEKLLKRALEAGARLAEAERQVQLARADYHALVRRLHLAGGSLRELAQALQMSHQRVQQMVDGAGGSWWQRTWRSRSLKGEMNCTFCKRPQSQVAKLIAGPKVFICDKCVGLAAQSMSSGAPRTAHSTLTPAVENARARCSFCRKRRAVDRAMVTGPSANICSECLGTCQQILIDTESSTFGSPNGR